MVFFKPRPADAFRLFPCQPQTIGSRILFLQGGENHRQSPEQRKRRFYAGNYANMKSVRLCPGADTLRNFTIPQGSKPPVSSMSKTEVAKQRQTTKSDGFANSIMRNTNSIIRNTKCCKNVIWPLICYILF